MRAVITQVPALGRVITADGGQYPGLSRLGLLSQVYPVTGLPVLEPVAALAGHDGNQALVVGSSGKQITDA